MLKTSDSMHNRLARGRGRSPQIKTTLGLTNMLSRNCLIMMEESMSHLRLDRLPFVKMTISSVKLKWEICT